MSAPSSDDDRAALSFLYGSRVERIDGPLPGLFAFTLYAPGHKQCLLLALSPTRRGVGISSQRPKGEAASAFVQRLRKKLDNARLLSARWLGGSDSTHATALELSFQHGPEQERIVADFDARTPLLILLAPQGHALGAHDEAALRKRFPERSQRYSASGGRGIACILDAAQAAAAGSALLEESHGQGEAALRAQLLAEARTVHKRCLRKVEAIRGDLARASAIPQLRREGNLLLTYLHAIPRGAAHVTLLDEATDPSESVVITLDPAQDARRNAEQRFERARKLERGTRIAGERLREAEAELSAVEARMKHIEQADISILQPGAKPAAPAPRKKRNEPQQHLAYRTFFGSAARPIHVGKGAADNDTLTLTVARPQDHFLHARSVHGAHVIIPREKNAQIPPELLLDAAHLAAHFSDARGERSVEIQHTERRYVRKSKGAAPGAVILEREKVLLLRIEPDRLAKLLANEKRQ